MTTNHIQKLKAASGGDLFETIAPDHIIDPEYRAAKFSHQKRNRHSLTRQWDRSKRFMVVVGLNPSIAGVEKDDQTIRRVRHFAKREGCGGLHMVNLVTFIATQPRDMWAQLGGFGEKIVLQHSSHLDCAMRMGGKILAAWGAFKGEEVLRAKFLERYHDKEIWCLGRTKSGAPRHPSRLPNNQPIERFTQ